MYYLLLPIILLVGCSSPEEPNRPPYEEIDGRTGGPLYRIRVPQEWRRHDPKEKRTDTKVALTELFIEGDIRITIHNFPNMSIPPFAQISRWRQQIGDINYENITPQSFSGYAGFLFEGKNGETTVLGWALQLEKGGADVTIKATGPNELVEKHRNEIIHVARSFELIQEL